MRRNKDKNEMNVEEFYKSGIHRQRYKGFYQLVVKRVADIILCLMILPLILLISIPLAIAIKVEDGGPVLYKSRRIGKNFKEFEANSL